MRARLKCLAQGRVELVDFTHDLVDMLRSIKPSDREVRLRSCTVHSRMLEYRVLLELFRTAPVVESNQISDGYTAIQNLPTDEHVQRSAPTELTVLCQQLLRRVLGVHLGNP